MSVAKHGWFMGTSIFLFLLLMTVPALADEVLTGYNNIHISMANTAKYDVYGDNTYYIQFKGEGKGLNAMHITMNPSDAYGQATVTSDYSGTFYITNTGDANSTDDAILLVAVRDDIPDDFSIHIKSSGYNVTPESHSLTDEYVSGALDQTFDTDDFLPGSQIWKPSSYPDYPLYCGQDMTDTDDLFHLMFIDLRLGVLTGGEKDEGAIKVEYTIENLQSITTFNTYSWSNASKAISWTNNVDGAGESGYVVREPPVATTIEVSPSSASLYVNEIEQFSATAYNQYDEEMTDVIFYWLSTNGNVGTINQNGFFEAASAGTTTIKATNSSAEGTANVAVSAIPVSPTQADDGPSSYARDLYLNSDNTETPSETPAMVAEEIPEATPEPTQSLKSAVTSTPAVEVTENPEEPKDTPGFGLGYAITGLLSALYLIRRRLVQ